METETINQAYPFIVFIMNGIWIGILFDFFRILRRSFQTKDGITYLEDALFWILTGVLLLYSIFVFNHGILRIYLLIAIVIGFLVYMLLFSKFVISVSVKIITIIKKGIQRMICFLSYPFKVIYKIIKSVVRPISFVCINLKKFTSKKMQSCYKKAKKLLFSKKKEGKQVSM